MIGPFFAFGSPGGELAFPTIAGRPVLVSHDQYEGCCFPVIPLVCAGIPSRDHVWEISRRRYVQWVSAGTWRARGLWQGDETHTTGGGGGSHTEMVGSDLRDVSASGGCISLRWIEWEASTTYYGYPTPGLVVSGSVGLVLDIALGMDAGRYYAGVTASALDIFWTSAGPDTGYGQASITMGGHVIPMRSTWVPGYSSYANYTNTYEARFWLDRM